MHLFEPEDLARAHAHYVEKQGLQTKTKAEILCEVVAEFPDVTAKELSEASGMSPSWVRRTLRVHGISLPPRQKRQKELQP